MHAHAIVFTRPLSYEEGLDLQHHFHAARLEDRVDDVLLVLQHEPVVTLGRRGRDNYLLLSKEEYERRGIALHTASRGGDVTFHAPGQWVLYPILKLGVNEADAHGYLENLEEIAIRTAADFNVSARRVKGKSGAWTDAGKIAAIGFHIKRWVTLHGMSFNVNLDLSGFQTIVPCGLEGDPVASLQTVLGEQTPSMRDVCDSLLQHFQAVCDRQLAVHRTEGALPELTDRGGSEL